MTDLVAKLLCRVCVEHCRRPDGRDRLPEPVYHAEAISRREDQAGYAAGKPDKEERHRVPGRRAEDIGPAQSAHQANMTLRTRPGTGKPPA